MVAQNALLATIKDPCLFLLGSISSFYCMPGLHNIRPACGTRELSQLQKMLQQLNFGYVINCLSRISFKLQQNGSDFATCVTFMLATSPFCGLRNIFVGQFGPSSVLRCAGLRAATCHITTLCYNVMNCIMTKTMLS